METQSEKVKRRRRLLLRNTSLVSVGYALPLCALVIVKELGFASYKYRDLVLLSVWVLLTNAGFIASIRVTLYVVVSYTSVSYVQIVYSRQAGSFSHELLYDALFFMAALYLFFAAGMFKRQRHQVVLAKRKAESANRILYRAPDWVWR